MALDVTLQVNLMHAIYADQKHALDGAVTVIVLVGTHGRGERGRAKQCCNREPAKSFHY
jgi:hypothetical protein